MKKIVSAFAASVLAMAIAAPANAALLLGKTIQLSYLFPDQGSIFEGPNNNTVGTTGDTVFFGLVHATPGDRTLTVTLPGFSGGFSGGSFNGVRLHDAFNTVAAFTSVTVSSLSNVAGFDASRVSFDADNIYLNFSGLNIRSDFFAQVDIGGGVPEPAAWALMIAGFGLVGAAARRRQSVRVTYA